MNFLNKTIGVTTLLASLATAATTSLRFEPNLGQTSPEVQFTARAAGHNLFFTPSESVIVTKQGATLRLRPANANPHVTLSAENPQPGRTSYLRGNQPSRWIQGVPGFGKVRYSNLYSNIDLTFYGTENQLEYDFEVHPGADPARIAFSFDGANRLTLSPDGSLLLHTTSGESRFAPPVAYQQINGRRQSVAARYTLSGGTIGFALGQYDPAYTLTIDPLLIYATLLGGTAEDQAYGIAARSNGEVVVTGATLSPNFPRAGTPSNPTNGMDVFVSRFSSTGGSLLYSVVIGGNGSEYGAAVKFDTAGNAIVTGATTSTNFPVLNAPQPALAGDFDAFVLRLSPTGTLVASTYLGGPGYDTGSALSIDTLGHILVAGTAQTGFPTSVNAFQKTTKGGDFSAFVARLNNSNYAILSSTLLGDTNGYDEATGVGFENSTIWVTGSTRGTAFPLKNAFQSVHGGGTATISDAFVSRLSLDLKSLLFSTYLGGEGDDYGMGLAIDSNGIVHLVGSTESGKFPTKNAFQDTLKGGADAFVTKLNPAGIIASTYLGGDAGEQGRAITIDSSNRATVVGFTSSANFPTASPIQPALSALTDAFITRFDLSMTSVNFSTFYGGTNHETALAVATSTKRLHVAGATNNPFPLLNPFQSVAGGAGDAFVLAIE